MKASLPPSRRLAGRLSLIGFSLLVLATPAAAQRASSAARVDSAALAGFAFREVGPAVMGGRIADVAVVEDDPRIFYLGTATAGVWKTTSHGAKWEEIFASQGHPASVGDVTLAPSNPNVVWVGTGEPQNRQSSPWGAGVYRSVDAGRTWTFLGLENTRHIGRILVHPRDPDVAWVAAVGHLWGPNAERGVFKTTDAGRTWEKVLFVDENTGAIDLAMHPDDPSTIFAAMYQRRRLACCFNGGGPGSGLYRSLDGGETWTRLENGLPERHMGRIGVDVYRRDPNLVYAVIEARGEGSGVYRSTDRGETWTKMSGTNPRPMYYSQIRIDPNNPERIYLGGADLYFSDDGGRTFSDEGAPEVHLDHHALWIDPNDSNHLIMGSDGGVSVSFDGSVSWRMYDNLPIAQFYEIGLDMQDPYTVCGGLQDNGSWCAPSETMSRLGVRNGDWYNVGGGDGFYVRIDPMNPRIMFVESQNGNIRRFDPVTGEALSIRPEPREGSAAARPLADTAGAEPTYRWNWNTPILISQHDPATVYVGANAVLKSTDRGHSWVEASPDLTKRIDRDTLPIMGEVTSDSMLSRHDGVSYYGTITTLHESPLDPRILIAGTDDGNVQITTDGGANWTDVTPNFRGVPPRTYVSRVFASAHDPRRFYVSFDGHYQDDYGAYVFASDDGGASWRRIDAGLPAWSVNVVHESPRDPDVLFVGNEVGVYASLDRGATWRRLGDELPTVPVDDIKIHPREGDLVIGTHGRGIWILHDANALHALAQAVRGGEPDVLPVNAAMIHNIASPQGWTPAQYEAENPPYGARIRYYLPADVAAADRPVIAEGEAGAGGPAARDGENGRRTDNGRSDAAPKIQLTVLDARGDVVREIEGPGTAGTHEVFWDLRLAPPYEPEEEEEGRGRFGGAPQGPTVLPGTYAVRLEAGARPSERFEVVGDRRVTIADADRRARQDVLLALYAMAEPLYRAQRRANELNRQLTRAQETLRAAADADSALKADLEAAKKELDETRREIGEVSSRARRLGFTVEGMTIAPTADALRTLGEVQADAPAAVERLNALIAELPALYARIYQQGARPDPGAPLRVPAGS